MGLFSTIMSSGGGRALGGAAAGGLIGGMNTGDLGGFVGGAAAGAAFGAGAPFLGGQLGRLGTVAGAGWGGASLAANAMRSGSLGLRRGLYKLGKGGTGFDRFTSKLGDKAAIYGLRGSAQASRAAGYIGDKAIAVNKYGGQGLAALGLGASAYIGSSMIGSNRGY